MDVAWDRDDMDTCRLLDLSEMHPRLLWDHVAASAASILAERFADAGEATILLEFQNVPNIGTGHRNLCIDFEPEVYDLTKVRRTYERERLVELAAIAITGLALYHLGGHEIVDVALRGSSVDYLVGTSGHSLEIGGRSHRRNFETGWQSKRRHLTERATKPFYLSLIEFETPAARIEFVASEGD